MKAFPATPGRWCDTDTRPTTAQAEALVAAGYVGIVRYVRLPRNDDSRDIDAAELSMLLGIGLEVMLVQHVRDPGWDPRSHDGQIDGATAAEHARLIGYPDGHIYLDLEGILPGTDASAVISYANAWAGRILQSGFRAGAYAGFDVPLTPEQWYEDLSVNSYWKDPGPRHVAERGFALVQGKTVVVAGLELDEDTLSIDQLGERPFACVP